MRGKGNCQKTQNIPPGITPAHAGKSFARNALQTSCEDHPRTCGEKRFTLFLRHRFKGSPPHMRGKGNGRKSFAGKQGITPAHAGKSEMTTFQIACTWDHPRTCGEKLTTFDAGKLVPGSPPHMRGKAFSQTSQDCRLGITPAHAGKRSPDYLHPQAS